MTEIDIPENPRKRSGAFRSKRYGLTITIDLEEVDGYERYI